MADDKNITVNEKTLEVLVAKFIPTSQYFERSFEMLQKQIDGLSEGQKRIQDDMDRRFEQVDRRFEQVDQRFEQVDQHFQQVDQRFEQVDQRFQQMIVSIDRLSDKLDRRDDEHRSFTLRMFSISIMISFLGVLSVFLKMFHVI
jgi:prefoldin subunit 5